MLMLTMALDAPHIYQQYPGDKPATGLLQVLQLGGPRIYDGDFIK